MIPLIFFSILFASSCEGLATFTSAKYLARKGESVVIQCQTDSPAIFMDHLKNVSTTRIDYDWVTVTDRYGNQNDTQVKVNKTSWSLQTIEKFVNFDDIIERKDSRIVVAKKIVNQKNIWTLEIKNVTQSDKGIYSCIEQNSVPSFIITNEKDSTKYTTLQVIESNVAKKLTPISLTIALTILIRFM